MTPRMHEGNARRVPEQGASEPEAAALRLVRGKESG
jgi:hypothetical protein